MDTLEKSYQQMQAHFLTPESFAKEGEVPRLMFVFGSPGVGKSTCLKPKLNSFFENSKPINLEIDEFKTFVPQVQNVNKLTDEWFARLTNKAIEEKRNIIIFRQRSMLAPTQTFGLYKKAKENGYFTQAVVMALDKERSRLGMVHRYECALENARKTGQFDRENYPRKPDFVRHYIFFRALPIIATACTKLKEIDRIDVYDRQCVLLASQDKTTGKKTKQTPIQALLKERHRSWNIWEKNRFNRQRFEAAEKMKERGSNRLEMLKFKFLTATPKNK